MTDADYSRRRRLIRNAEHRAGAGAEIGGTGATILKFIPSPLARLAERGRITMPELRAADDIAVAFHAQAGALMLRAPSIERRDPSYHSHEPTRVIDAVARYKRWAAHWSAKAQARPRDRTLEIVIAAVIDERPFTVIDEDLGIRHGTAVDATIAGLRDYAARAGWA